MALEDRIQRGEAMVDTFHPGTSSSRMERVAVTVSEILCYGASHGIPADEVLRNAESIFKSEAT